MTTHPVATAQQTVERIWADVLDLRDASTGGSFFELNGDSIAAVRLVSRIEDELGVSLEVGDIFEEDPDLAALVRNVASQAEGGTR